MESLRELLGDASRFLIGAELVSIRGSMAEKSAARARSFASQLVDRPSIDWVSITDNAGGNPQLAPQALAKPLLYAGKEVVIHLTCKDLNRNGLESEAWQLNSEGFHNVLAMSGDYPVGGSGGAAKPVFDLDSIGLIRLLDRMNKGFDEHHEKTQFTIGAVVNPYKAREGELMPQYLKLQKKVACGAAFIITQVGYDTRKAHELRLYMDHNDMGHVPLIGNVFVLNVKTARMFNAGRIPGVVVSEALRKRCEKEGASPDGGKRFFCEFAARQIAVYRGLGYRGAYLGGTQSAESIDAILETVRMFSPDDWKEFAKDMLYSRRGEFYFYRADPKTHLSDGARPNMASVPGKGFSLQWAISRAMHRVAFSSGKGLAPAGAWLCAHASDSAKGPAPLRALERFSKSVLYGCRDCGDCSLPETAFLCPESRCAKNQRNGPCGGSRNGHCEVDGYGECMWMLAYERLQRQGRPEELLDHVPVLQDQRLRGTSSWANFWLGRDHTATSGTTTQEDVSA